MANIKTSHGKNDKDWPWMATRKYRKFSENISDQFTQRRVYTHMLTQTSRRKSDSPRSWRILTLMNRTRTGSTAASRTTLKSPTTTTMTRRTWSLSGRVRRSPTSTRRRSRSSPSFPTNVSRFSTLLLSGNYYYYYYYYTCID